MNWAFVGYEELSRSRRVLSSEADNTLLDLLNSSYPTKAQFIICFIIHSKEFLVQKHSENMLTCIAVNFIFDSVRLGLSSSAKILQIADVALRVVFFLFLLCF